MKRRNPQFNEVETGVSKFSETHGYIDCGKYRCSEILSLKNFSPLHSKGLFVCLFVTFSERFLQIVVANLTINKVDCCVMVVHLELL